MRVLKRADNLYLRIRVLALLSFMIHRVPDLLNWIERRYGDKYAFKIWHPGFDLTYSSQKLLQTSFSFKWTNFEDVFYSCLDDK